MVVQPAVRDQEHLSARNLAVDNAGHIDAGLTHQVAAEFDHQRGLRHFALGTLGQLGQVVADGSQIEPALTGEVRDAEAATQVEEAHRLRRKCREPQG